MNLQAEIYIVCKKPIKHSRSVPERRRESPSLKSETTKMLHEKNKTLKKTKCRWCRFLFFQGRSQRWVCRTASRTDAAGRPARGPISASCDVELGPPRTKAPPVLLAEATGRAVRCQQLSITPVGPGRGEWSGGLPASGSLSGLFHNCSPEPPPPSCCTGLQKPSWMWNQVDNGTLASFNSRQSSGSGGKHFHKRSICLSGHLQNEEMPLTSYRASCLESLWMEEGIYICPCTNSLCSWKKNYFITLPVWVDDQVCPAKLHINCKIQ